MKNYYCLALTFLFVMSANSQVIRYSVLDVESENREKFIKGLEDKTKIYNSKEEQDRVYTFSILSGNNAYNYARVVVRNSFGEFGTISNNSRAGREYYMKNVSPYMTSTGSYFMEAQEEASYTPKNGVFQDDLNFRRVILYTFKDSHRDDFWRFRMRMKKAMESLGKNRMGVLRCISGCNGNKVMVRFHFKDYKEDEDFFDNLSDVSEEYDKMYGEESFSEDIDRMWSSLESKKIWHERRINTMSSPF